MRTLETGRLRPVHLIACAIGAGVIVTIAVIVAVVGGTSEPGPSSLALSEVPQGVSTAKGRGYVGVPSS